METIEDYLAEIQAALRVAEAPAGTPEADRLDAIIRVVEDF
jgi:hypothetical protein